MMAAEIIADLEAVGVRVRAEGDQLRLAGPRTALSPDLLARCRAAKPEILALLGSPLDQGLACREVLGLAAELLALLPVPTTLIVEPARGGPYRSLPASSPEWSRIVDRAPTHSTVARALAVCELRLRVVIIEGGL